MTSTHAVLSMRLIISLSGHRIFKYFVISKAYCFQEKRKDYGFQEHEFLNRMCTCCNSQVQHKNDPAKKSNRNFDALLMKSNIPLNMKFNIFKRFLENKIKLVYFLQYSRHPFYSLIQANVGLFCHKVTQEEKLKKKNFSVQTFLQSILDNP